MRDSAGVTITLSDRPAWAAGTGWRVSDVALLRIGDTSGAPSQELFRVIGAARLGDGAIAVANAGTQEIRIFDPRGRFLRALGRKGEGPGEFATLSGMQWLPGDTLLAFDSRLKRVSAFTVDGRLVDLVSFAGAGSSPSLRVVGRLASGVYLVWGGSSPSGTPTPGLRRDSVLFRLFGADAGPLETLGRFPGGIFDVQERRFGGTLIPFSTAVAFSPSALGHVHGDGAYVSSTDRYEVRVYDGAGDLRRIVRRAFEGARVTPADVQAFLEDARRRSTGSNPVSRAFLEALEAAPTPDRLPAFRQLLIGRDGYLWFEDFPRPREPLTRWQVFDPEGRFLGPVGMPPGFDVLELGGDYVLARHADSLGVESVVLFRLSRS